MNGTSLRANSLIVESDRLTNLVKRENERVFQKGH